LPQGREIDSAAREPAARAHRFALARRDARVIDAPLPRRGKAAASHALFFIVRAAAQGRVARCRNTDHIGWSGEDGLALTRWLREKSARVGIVMITAASETVDRVVGLETGVGARKLTTSQRLWDRRGRPLPGRSQSTDNGCSSVTRRVRLIFRFKSPVADRSCRGYAP
jgi:hypothetical protein